MICENTISAGFYFMLGKLLFDLSVLAVVAVFMLLVVLILVFWPRRKFRQTTKPDYNGRDGNGYQPKVKQ